MIFGTFTRCKKNNDKAPECRIISATGVPGGASYQLTYDNTGKLSRVVLGQGVITYDYTGNGNMVTVTNMDSGQFRSRTVVTLNPVGLASNVRVEDDLTGATWSNTSYEYNGDELSRSTSTSSAGGAPSVSTYTWSDGNMISATTDPTGPMPSTSTFEYYTDKPRQNGDFLLLLQLLQGYEIYRNKNLIKGISGAVLTYIFAKDGKIASLEVAEGTTSFLDYQYQCN